MQYFNRKGAVYMSIENTHYGSKSIEKMLNGVESIFFVGIGGVSMSSLAYISKAEGYTVGGSDRTKSAVTAALETAGMHVFYSHSAENIKGYGAVIYTVAIADDNPEYTAAKTLGIPLISRADYLGYIMMKKPHRLGIAGMHGKSTCTSMCAAVYMAGNADPTVVSGAEYKPMGGYYRTGSGDSFIFEACEYMDSFLDFNPTTAVILNVELEHVDYFKTLERVRASYARFAALTGSNGTVICNGDDDNTEMALSDYSGKLVRFGLDRARDLDYLADNIEYTDGCPSFDIYRRGEYFCRIELSVTGRYNIYNALATAAAADLDGIKAESIVKGLKLFCGAGRRMEYKGRLHGCRVFDDYGHHPTEIVATLSGAKALCKGGKLLCLFQPHTYSRTAALFDDFVSSLSVADRVMLAPIYAARENNVFGVSSDGLAAAIGKNAVAYESVAELGRALNKADLKDTTIVIMGAGNINEIYKILELKE